MLCADFQEVRHSEWSYDLLCGDGNIPDEMSPGLQRMPKEYGVEFGHTDKYPYSSVATTSTHDMSGIRRWWAVIGYTMVVFPDLHEACSTSNDVDRMDCLSVLPQDFCDELNRITIA